MSIPRDVDLAEWLDSVGFHPADTEMKRLGHEAARRMIAFTGEALHKLLPAGRDKSLAFVALEDVLMRANRAIALASGPAEGNTVEQLRLLTEIEVPGFLGDPRVDR